MMKRWIALVLGIAVFPGAVFAADDAHSIPVKLTVKERFGIKMHHCELDLGDVRQGRRSHRRVVRFSATTNRGMEWAIQIQADPLRHEDGRTDIPGDRFRFFVEESPSGGGAGGGQPVPAGMQTIYTADPGHYVAENALFGLGFDVDVPQGQKTGRYNGSVTIRMTDSL